MGRSSPAVVLAAMVVLVVAAAAAASGGIDFGEEDLASEEALWALYERWSAEYKVRRDVGEKVRRFSIFKQNARYVHDFNQLGNASYTLGLNIFGDMTNEEINEIYSNPYLNEEGQQEAHAKALQYFMILYGTLACFAFLFILFTFVSALLCRAEKREMRV